MVVFAQRGLWGTIVRRWPIDLFPVRRRLCLETVCFPEETPHAVRRGAGSRCDLDGRVRQEPGQPDETD